MLEREIMGHIIWEASTEEIRKAWPNTPVEDLHRWWSHEEVTPHILDDPQQLQDCIDKKIAKPGRL
jgi:hypothetical protein